MQAALITAYKDYPALVRLIEALAAENVAVFLHIDAKARFSRDELATLAARTRLCLRRYTIHWGSYTHLAAIIDLLRAALADPAVDFIHLLSGQDYPVRRLAGAVDPGAIHMEVIGWPDLSALVRDRIAHAKLLHRIEGVRWLYRPLNKALLAVQRRLGSGRNATRTYGNIYKGLVWLSLPAAAARHCLDDPQARALLRELRGFYVPEEYFFQTVLMNSPFRDAIVADNRRFDIWHERHGTIPAILDAGDLPAIVASDALFARKLQTGLSTALADALDANRFSGP